MLYRTCLFLAALFAFITVLAQHDPYVLRGRIKGLHHGKVRLLFDTNLYDINLNDSASVSNGAFEIKGRLPQPYPYATYLWLNDSIRTGMFFVGKGIQEISIDIHHFMATPAADSGINAENAAYLQSMMPNDNTVSDLFDRKDALIRLRYKGNPPSGVTDSLNAALEDIKTAKDIYLKNYILTYPSSYVGLWYLYCRVLSQGYRPELLSAFENLNGNLKNNNIGRQIRLLLENTRKITIGALFPRLQVETLPGRKEHFIPTKNKKIIFVDFWYSRCGPCISQFARLKELYSEFSARGFEVVGISTDKESERKLWRSTITQYKLPWVQLLDVNQTESLKIAIDYFPYNFILDSNGKILYKNVSLIQLKQILEENCM